MSRGKEKTVSFMAFIKKAHAEGKTVIIGTHDDGTPCVVPPNRKIPRSSYENSPFLNVLPKDGGAS